MWQDKFWPQHLRYVLYAADGPKGGNVAIHNLNRGVLFLQVMEKVGMSWNLPVKPSKLDGVGYALAISSSLLHQERGNNTHIQNVCMPQRNSQKVYR